MSIAQRAEQSAVTHLAAVRDQGAAVARELGNEEM